MSTDDEPSPAHDSRLLRPARRRDPLPRAAGHRVKLGHDPKRLGYGMTHTNGVDDD
jgi:hypothetical protein